MGRQQQVGTSPAWCTRHQLATRKPSHSRLVQQQVVYWREPRPCRVISHLPVDKAVDAVPHNLLALLLHLLLFRSFNVRHLECVLCGRGMQD